MKLHNQIFLVKELKPATAEVAASTEYKNGEKKEEKKYDPSAMKRIKILLQPIYSKYKHGEVKTSFFILGFYSV